jgi:3-hydroxyisobutyrate dehydrogenase-like beta-hydroxyacid dehydrogenase
MEKESMAIGFVGLGKMGAPMAHRLLESGHTVHAFDLDATAVNAFVSKGGRRADTLQMLGVACETVFLSLPSPSTVENVALDETLYAEGSVVRYMVDFSTTGAASSRRIAAQLSSRNVVFVDAPVSGGVAGAIAGTLAVMISCDREVLEILKPLMRCIGNLFHVGERPGLGQTMKLLNNYLSAMALAATSEAVVVGIKHGLAPATIIEVINAGSGRTGASLDKFPRAILPGTFDSGFTTGLMCKDLGLFLEEAETVGVTLPLAHAVGDIWYKGRQLLGPASDYTRIIQPIAQQAGVRLEPTKRQPTDVDRHK